MAQGDQRPRHNRLPSRIPRSANSSDDGGNGTRLLNRQRPTDEATVKYVKRILCASITPLGSNIETISSDVDSMPLDELLPPLTSSNEVDVQLYAIIAVILSQFVQSWYNRITPDNHFVAEVVQIIAHCTRGLEERLRHVDLEDLLLEEVPALIIVHIDGMYPDLLSKCLVTSNLVQLSELHLPRAPIIGHQTMSAGFTILLTPTQL